MSGNYISMPYSTKLFCTIVVWYKTKGVPVDIDRRSLQSQCGNYVQNTDFVVVRRVRFSEKFRECIQFTDYVIVRYVRTHVRCRTG